MIVVIPCGVSKADRPAPAMNFYTGALFRGALAYARSVCSTDRIYVLSARYGLVPIDRVLNPYDRKLTGVAEDDVRRVSFQAQDLEILDEPVLSLCSGPYRGLLRQVFEKVVDPFEGQRDMRVGKRLQAMKCNRGRLPREIREVEV